MDCIIVRSFNFLSAVRPKGFLPLNSFATFDASRCVACSNCPHSRCKFGKEKKKRLRPFRTNPFSSCERKKFESSSDAKYFLRLLETETEIAFVSFFSFFQSETEFCFLCHPVHKFDLLIHISGYVVNKKDLFHCRLRLDRKRVFFRTKKSNEKCGISSERRCKHFYLE